MDNEKNRKDSQTEKINEILYDVRTAVDFYRMEYSENLTILFNDTGFFLIVHLFYEGYFMNDQKIHPQRYDSNRIFPKIEEIRNQPQDMMELYQERMVRGFTKDSKEIGIFSGLREFQFTIKKSSVLRHIQGIVKKICELWDQTEDKEIIYDVVCQIHKLCTNGRGDNGTYTLPDSVVTQLVQLMNPENIIKNFNSPIRVLDPQCGSGEMLIAAGRYLKEAELWGSEVARELRISAQILSIFSGRVIYDVEEDILREGVSGYYDIVLANPPFSNENVQCDPWRLPNELGHIKGKYNLLIVRSLQVLTMDGRAIIIVPDSFLFSSKKESIQIRRWILDRYGIEMILSLPGKTFDSNSSVRSSALIINNPLEGRSWHRPTEYILFYRLNAEPGSKENEEEYKELLRIRNQSSYYYNEWKKRLRDRQENQNNVFTPEDWDYPDFWFADYDVITANNCNLLPDYYKPMEKIQLQFEAPDQLLEELITDQEAILKCMYELREEIQKI